MGQKFARNRSISYGFRDIDTFPFSAKMQDGRGKWRKLKFFPFHRTLLCHPVGKKFARNRSICYGFRGIDTFSFSAKIQDGRRKWRKLKFSPFPQDTLVPTYGSKIFARNRSISYGFRDIDTFPLSAKIQDGCQKWRKLKFSPIRQETLVPPCGSNICSKSLYLLWFSRY